MEAPSGAGFFADTNSSSSLTTALAGMRIVSQDGSNVVVSYIVVDDALFLSGTVTLTVTPVNDDTVVTFSSSMRTEGDTVRQFAINEFAFFISDEEDTGGNFSVNCTVPLGLEVEVLSGSAVASSFATDGYSVIGDTFEDIINSLGGLTVFVAADFEGIIDCDVLVTANSVDSVTTMVSPQFIVEGVEDVPILAIVDSCAFSTQVVSRFSLSCLNISVSDVDTSDVIAVSVSISVGQLILTASETSASNSVNLTPAVSPLLNVLDGYELLFFNNFFSGSVTFTISVTDPSGTFVEQHVVTIAANTLAAHLTLDPLLQSVT